VGGGAGEIGIPVACVRRGGTVPANEAAGRGGGTMRANEAAVRGGGTIVRRRLPLNSLAPAKRSAAGERDGERGQAARSVSGVAAPGVTVRERRSAAPQLDG
jgi:hypothetical protein